MQRQIPLIIMEVESESSKSVEKHWNVLHKALANQQQPPFNPFGLISDEAGAFWNAAIKHFDEETIANSVSCEFHFKENVNKHTNKIVREEDEVKFKKLCYQWLEATTTAGMISFYFASITSIKFSIYNSLKFIHARDISGINL